MGRRRPQPVEQGVRPLLFAATSPDVRADLSTGPAGPRDDALVGAEPFRAPVTDPALAELVWDRTAELTGAPDPVAVPPLAGGRPLR